MFGNTQAAPPVTPVVANIDADQVSTNQQAIPVPWLFGWARMPLHFVAPVYNQVAEKVTAQTGKDTSSTVGFIYYGDVAGVFCVLDRRATLGRARRYIIDSSIAWENTAGLVIGNPYSPITLADYGATRQYAGLPTQAQDTLVLTPIATTVPSGVNPRDTSTWPNGDETLQQP